MPSKGTIYLKIMTTSANQNTQDRNIIEGLMRALTNIVNEQARMRKHTREAINENTDEMCRQYKETTYLIESLFKEVQHIRKVLEAIVHHYHQEEQDD